MPNVINAKGWNKGNHRLWKAQVDQVSPSDGCKSGKQECSLSVQVIIRALTYGRQSRGNRWISAGASFSSRRGFRRLEAGSFQAAHKNHQRSAKKTMSKESKGCHPDGACDSGNTCKPSATSTRLASSDGSRMQPSLKSWHHRHKSRTRDHVPRKKLE